MIINKITTGFVVQQFDTATDTWVSQEFVAGDECNYENRNGEAVESSLMGDPEPYLPFTMVEPTKDVQSCRQSIQDDLLALLDGLPEEAQTAACQIVVDNFNKFHLI